MDGVLVNNMGVHFEAFAEMGRRYNISAEPGKDFSHLNGRGNEDIITALFPEWLVKEKGVDGLAAEKEAVYREIYAPKIRPTDGLVDFLARLKEEGFVCAVGSSGPKDNVECWRGAALATTSTFALVAIWLLAVNPTPRYSSLRPPSWALRRRSVWSLRMLLRVLLLRGLRV